MHQLIVLDRFQGGVRSSLMGIRGAACCASVSGYTDYSTNTSNVIPKTNTGNTNTSTNTILRL